MRELADSCLLGGIDELCDNSVDEQKATSIAISGTLKLILEKELTKRQYECIKLFYFDGLSQTEIAQRLMINQSTVCRHLRSAKSIINKILTYCYYSVNQANEQWLKML